MYSPPIRDQGLENTYEQNEKASDFASNENPIQQVKDERRDVQCANLVWLVELIVGVADDAVQDVRGNGSREEKDGDGGGNQIHRFGVGAEFHEFQQDQGGEGIHQRSAMGNRNVSRRLSLRASGDGEILPDAGQQTGQEENAARQEDDLFGHTLTLRLPGQRG